MLRRPGIVLLFALIPAALPTAADASRSGRADGAEPRAAEEPAPEPAPTAAFDATDPKSVLSALQDYGIRASLGRTDGGYPLIESRIAQSDFRMIFHGCSERRNCYYAVLIASWEAGGPEDPTQVAGRWNDERVFGRAWVDPDGTIIGLDHTIVLRGLPRETMDENLTAWGDTVEDFVTYLDEKLWNGDEPERYDASSRDI